MAKAEETKSLEDVLQLRDKVKAFESLVDKLDSLDDKKKALWKEIYENAITDRINGYKLFVELHSEVKKDLTQHAIMGPLLAKYMERMSKANDQLIKLVEMISVAEKVTESLTEDDIYKSARTIK